jgi:hypothetical protein
MRLLALLLLLAVLPTAELGEQLVHAIEHLVHHEDSAHSAHHEAHGDEHGCTSLVHLCGHQAQVTTSAALAIATTIETLDTTTIEEPAGLRDLTAREPAHRPPIA